MSRFAVLLLREPRFERLLARPTYGDTAVAPTKDPDCTINAAYNASVPIPVDDAQASASPHSREPLLSGIAFTGFRSFAGPPQRFLFPTPVTVIAGVNNSGKSNVLRYVQNVLPTLHPRTGTRGKGAGTLPLIDLPAGYAKPAPHILAFPVKYEALQPRDLSRTVRQGQFDNDSDAVDAIATLLADEEGSDFWVPFLIEPGGATPHEEFCARIHDAVEEYRRGPGSHYISGAFEGRLAQILQTRIGQLGSPSGLYQMLLRHIGAFDEIPPVVSISASRRVESNLNDTENIGAGNPHWLSGRGLIQELAKVQNPEHDNWKPSRAKWNAINSFLQHVISDPDARLNIPHSGNALQIETPRRVLPLSSLGSGIEQVVVLAAAATMTVEHVVCMEEPESNLHPTLQRKLIRYLHEKTTNQYLIATHSAHFLDYEHATVYHLRLGRDGTVAQRARKAGELFRVVRDLGYAPSDILQTNCIIWVEGPADRIYIRHWLSLIAPQLAEGRDFDIMFYGGSLVTHLSMLEDADAKAIDDFILLTRLNRACAIVMDSDRTGPRAHLKPAVRRIKQELEQSKDHNFHWITKGYTIENYVPLTKLTQAAKAVHPRKLPLEKIPSQWKSPLTAGARKVEIARFAVAGLEDADLDQLDLRNQITRLARFIESSNESIHITDSARA